MLREFFRMKRQNKEIINKEIIKFKMKVIDDISYKTFFCCESN
jgi:hypothetical protein